MRVVDFETGEPFELNPDKIECVEAREIRNSPADGQSTGVVVVQMVSGRKHLVFVNIWDDAPNGIESNQILDHWAAIVDDERQLIEMEDDEFIPARTFRDNVVKKG